MKAIITGASGFLGTHLANRLLSENIELYSLGNNQTHRFHHYPVGNRVDKRMIDACISEVRPDFIFHLAGTTKQESLMYSFTVNRFFALKILQSLEDHSLDTKTTIVLIGSAAEYGLVNEDDLPIRESKISNPIDLYGHSKVAQSKISLSWSNEKRKLIILRPFNIIGPNMPIHLALGNFVNQINSFGPDGGQLKTGNLNTSRDFIDVRDATEIIWRLSKNRNAYGEVVNLCTGKSTLLSKLLAKLIENSGKSVMIQTKKNLERKNDMTDHYGDNDKLISLLNGYRFKEWEESIKYISQYDE